ncbi:putative glycolipid-binding domain-containing protein [Kitasatospora sp. MY 5-36]|uniref:putative glycolipid-binding domain-containing protein n=1 Tax=Kitasatospora sp. MY 5-36 TaxID=1678027 RepID=UPI0009E66784|nr:putative glycolipid-binding domain-containing protein [Kitasatospora sp. MY 5-36]
MNSSTAPDPNRPAERPAEHAATRTAAPTWRVTETAGLETSWIDLGPTALTAHGRAAAAEPAPYWLDYRLDTGDGFTTRRMHVTARTPDTTRTLDLRRDETTGHWTVDGTPRPDLDGALDCDLGLSPLTNTPPVLRHGLHLGPGEHHFLMAWIRVPELVVVPSRQTYTHLRRHEDGRATVRYASGDYRADLLLDADGLVAEYPGLAHRIA